MAFSDGLVQIEIGLGTPSEPVASQNVNEFPVALVCMPWGSVELPSMALGILKQCLEDSGFRTDLHYLNMAFAKQLGLELYMRFSTVAFVDVEWFFSYNLFGPGGSNEIDNEWDTLAGTSLAKNLVNTARRDNGTPEEAASTCRSIATKEVPEFMEHCMTTVDWSKYKVVGFTTTFAQSLSSLLLAKMIKTRFPSVKIVFGGANVDSEMGLEFIRGFDWIDFVVHGEAEQVFPQLLNHLARAEEPNLTSVSMRLGNQLSLSSGEGVPVADLNTSPVPDYADYIESLKRTGLYKKLKLKLYFESSRGCWWGAKHHCTFCGLNGSTMSYRKKTPERVYAEIMELSRRYDCLNLSATDNILAPEYFLQLLPKLESADLDFELFYEVKANLSRQQVKALAAAGVRTIQPGVESLNSRLLKLMNKGITAIQNIQLLKFCREYDVRPAWNLLTGFPGERPEDYKDLARTMLVLFHLEPPGGFSPVLFERFSPYFYNREEYGLNLVPFQAYGQIYPSDRVSLDRIAYFFEELSGFRAKNWGLHLEAARKVCDQWRNLHYAGSVRCTYRRGPEYIVINDNRPMIAGAAPVARRLIVRGAIAKIYEFCSEIRSFRSVCSLLRDGSEVFVGEGQIKKWLNALIAQGLMYREGEQYLSLAIRERRRAI